MASVCVESTYCNVESTLILDHTVVAGDDVEPSVEKKIQVPPKYYFINR